MKNKIVDELFLLYQIWIGFVEEILYLLNAYDLSYSLIFLLVDGNA